jgi:hypothetical protein
MPSRSLYCVALIQTDVSVNVLSPSSGVFRFIGVHGNTILEKYQPKDP